MLKKPITYEDFNGNTTTDVFYFHLSKPELIKMEVEQKNGLEEMIKRIIETKDHDKLITLFQDVILKSYGIKSDDGKRFIKTEELREEFVQTAAYEVLFMELATNDSKAAEFLKGVLPKDMAGDVDKAMATPSVAPNS